MSTLLIRLKAPLQSWGGESKFNERKTWYEPSKSGVLGMIASALGYRRDNYKYLEQLQKLRFGVRVDQPGELLCDFHTVVPYERNKKGSSLVKTDRYGRPLRSSDQNKMNVTRRYYLSDAVFVVGLESEDSEQLRTIAEALRHPAFPLYLGRRSCPPDMPLLDQKQGLDIVDIPLIYALRIVLWQASSWWQKRYRDQEISLRIVADADARESGALMVRDVPQSYMPTCRRYESRAVQSQEHVLMRAVATAQTTEHDAFEAVQAEE